MIRLRTLGETDLRSTDDGRRHRSVLAQPKRFALLVYLAVEPPGGFIRRDLVLALFWPEFDESRGRAALRKSLYHLRRSLGDEVLVSRGDEEVGLDRGRLCCDVAAFQEALEANRLEEALELYRGDFLPGFHLSGLPGFEEWLDGVRLRLRREAARAARRLEEAAEAEGAWGEAADWARRALEIDPLDEEALRRLLALLDRSGNRAEAARTWERFAERLEAELGVEPSPETRQVAERIEARELPAPGDVDLSLPEASPPVGVPGSEEDRARRRPRLAAPGVPSRWRAAAAVVAVLGMAGLAFAVWPASSDNGAKELVAPPEAAAPERVLVVDFEALGADTLLADALSEALRIGLAQSPALTVASREAIAGALQRMRRSPGERLTLELAREVAIREGIGTVVGGRVRRAGAGYVIGASLVEAETGEVMDGWLETPRDSTQLTRAIEGLATAIRDQAAGWLASGGPAPGAAAEPLRPLTTPSLPALKKYTQARRAGLGGDFTRAIELLEESISLDSTFAAGHNFLAVNVALTYTSRGRELEALSRAFRLRDQLTEAERYSVAGQYFRTVGDLPRAIEAFRGETEATGAKGGHGWIGIALVQAGHLAEAERVFREGRNPGSAFAHEEMLIRILHRTGHREEALALLREAGRDYPGHPIFAELRVELAIAAGEYGRADSLAALIPLGGSVGLAERHPLRHRAVIDAIRGRYAEALRHLAELRDLQLAREMREPAWNTTIYAGRLGVAFGTPEAAVAEIEAFLERVPPGSLHPLGRPFIYLPLADFFVEAGRPDRARTFLEAYDRIITPEFQRPGRARRHLVAAKLHAAEGEAARALEELSRALAEVRLHGQFDHDLPIQVPVGDRPEVARLHEAAGRPDSAVAVYERYLENRALRRAWLDGYELGPALERLAELHEASGRPPEAARHYRRLAALWTEADPELRLRVEEALRRAERVEPRPGRS